MYFLKHKMLQSFVKRCFAGFCQWSILMLFLSTNYAGYSQTFDLNFEHITDEDGLSNTSVEVIFQDSRGFIWIGTRNGLNRYDGYDIRTFFNDPKNANSLTDNYITSIFEDNKQNLWIGTKGGLNRYDQKRNHFIRYPNHEGLNSSVNHISEDTQHVVWFSSMDGGIYQVDADKKTASRWSYLPESRKGEKLIIYDFVWDKSKNLWMGTSKGLLFFDQVSRKLVGYPVHVNANLPAIPIHKLMFDANGNIWLASQDQGLFVLNQKFKTFRRYKHSDIDPSSLGSDNVTSLLLDNQKNIWVGCLNGGLNRFETKTNSFVNYEREPGNALSLSQKSVKSLFMDRQANLWIGTLRGGVNVYVPLATKFNLHRQQLTSNSLSYNDVRGFCEDHTGKLWVGADGGGLNLFDRGKNTFIHYRHQPGNPNSLSSDAVMNITEDSHNNLWIATYGGGLNRFEPSTGSFQHFMHDSANPGSISSDFVQKVLEDSQKNIWVATYTGGLNRLDLKTMRFERIRQDPSGKTKLTGNQLISINEGHDQNIWICTEDGGLNRYDLRTKQFSHYFDQPSVKQDLVVIFTDSKDRLWIGKKGLYLYDQANDRFNLYADKAGLSNEFIKGILEDKQGNLWVSSSNGLTQFNPETRIFRNFNMRDGLQGLEFEDNSCLVTRNGEFFFGGVNGFNTFYPDRININRFVPEVYLTEFQISNKNMGVGRPDSPLINDISYTDEIHLDYDQSTFSFSFAALNLVVPENNHYAYKLEGLEDKWITAGTERRASYTNLGPGDYTFHVKASNNDTCGPSNPEVFGSSFRRLSGIPGGSG